MNHICIYCGADAAFQFKNGKWCCSDSKNKCPINKNNVKEYALREWKDLKSGNISHKKDKPKELRKTKQIEHTDLCSYGCGCASQFILSNNRSCCSEYYYLCKAVKERRSQGIKNTFKNGKIPHRKGKPSWNKDLTKQNDKRVCDIGKRLSDKYKNKELIPTGLGRKPTEETKQKISKSRIEYLILHPDQVPYKLNHSSRVSYPEKYFKLLFSIEKIPLLYHKQVGLYELDFYNEEKMRYVEIDGESHYSDKKTIEIDKRRTVFLSEKGWTGMRVRWSTYMKYTKKEKMGVISEIRNFLE